MFENLKQSYNQNKLSTIITSTAALAGALIAIKKKKAFLGVVLWSGGFALLGLLLSSAINNVTDSTGA